MERVNLRDPNTVQSRIHVGHLNDKVTQELLDIKLSPYRKIAGILRPTPGFLAGQKLLVKAAVTKSQKRAMAMDDAQPTDDGQPMNKKYFSEVNDYYGNNSIMNSAPQGDSDINHCEIIVVSKNLTSYAEQIEKQLKDLGIRVDLLFPNDQVPINKVLGNIQSRGCLYAILVQPINIEQNSLTLTILYGDPAEHRSMPVDDAVKFIYKDFVNKTKKTTTPNVYQHPDAVQTLLKTLSDNRSLTVLQYDHLIKHLTQRREVQRKAEIGEDADADLIEPPPIFATPVVRPLKPVVPTLSKQEELQKEVKILNRKPIALAKPADVPTKPMKEAKKNELKERSFKDDKATQELLNMFSRPTPGFAFIQYEQPSSATNAIQSENGSFLAGQKLLVKAAEMKSQKRAMAMDDAQPTDDGQPMNKKYFSEVNDYYGNNSIMNSAPQGDSDINHCEIIVVSKNLTSYAEQIEKQLKDLGIRVDLLFPNDQVPINKVLGNIQSRGCLYAILVQPINIEQNSLTLTILYGDPAEHRSMPVDDAVKFIYKDFVNKTKKTTTPNVYQHPDAVQTLLKTLSDNRSLTVLQYDHLIKHLTQRREVQRKAEIGEDADADLIEPPPIFATPVVRPLKPVVPTLSKQEELQKEVKILNRKPIALAKPADVPTKPMKEAKKNELKERSFKDDKATQELLNMFSRPTPGFAFIQYEQPSSATNAIQSENGSFLAGQKLLVKAAEMKSQKRAMAMDDAQPTDDGQPMNKKYFSEVNDYYGNNSIMNSASQGDSVNKTKKTTTLNVYQHPDAVQTLLKTLSDNRSLTVLQYDHLIKHLTQRREVQRKVEIGEDADADLIEPPPIFAKKKMTEAQKNELIELELDSGWL